MARNINKTGIYKYYLLDTKKSILFYRSHGDLDVDHVELITSYAPDSSHSFFFNTLTYLQKHLDTMEHLGKTMIEYAQKRDNERFLDILDKLYIKLKKLHPFFNTDLACIDYILQTASSYYNTTRLARTIEYLQQSTSNFDKANHFLHDTDRKTITYIIQYSTRLTKDAMWLSCALSSITALIKDTSRSDEQKFRNSNDTSSLITPVRFFSTLYELRELISNYSHTADEYLDYYPHLSLLQLNTLFFSTHPRLNEIIHLSKPYTSSETLNTILWWKLKRDNSKETNINNLVDLTTSNFGNEITDLLYEAFNEQMLSEKESTSAIEKEIIKYFPSGIEKYFTYTLTNLGGFNEFLATEFYYILSQGIAIHKCAHKNCNTYILAKNKKTRYCSEHSNATSYQKNYSEQTECHEYFIKLKLTLFQRVKRGALSSETYKDFLKEAKMICTNHSKPKTDNSSEYKQEFSSLLKELNIKEVRKYHV